MTLHRFVHLGDLHLGPNSRNADRIRALDQVIGENLREPGSVAAWLAPGDLNHSRMTIEDRNVLADRLTRMANHAPVVIVYGNHDLPGDLDVMARLHAVWPIYVVSRPQVLQVPLATGPTAAIFCLPYPTRAGLVAAGTPSSDLVEAARNALDVIFMAAAADLRYRTAQGDIPLMIGHVNVAGSITSSGQPNIGQEIELDPTLIQRLSPIYVGLNHIHKAQGIGGAHYAGSLCRLDWGEIEPKRYLVITYGPGNWGGHAGDGPYNGCADFTWDIESKPIDVAPMYHVEGTLDRDGFRYWIQRSADMSEPPSGAVVENVIPKCCVCGGTGDGRHDPVEGTLTCENCLGSGQTWRGCEVRVRYRFNADEKTALDEALVRQPFEGAARLELDPIAVHSRAIRAPEVVAAQTLTDKVRAFCEQSRIIWRPSLLDKLDRVQQPDGAAFLTTVAQELSESRQELSRRGRSSELPVEGAEQRADSDHRSPEEVTL